ncbi:DUF3347 domain-containing protein [Pseudodesulfovibrio tunisiensis]|uniref:DUF3347 domain-containing protein n=1 Tax=Pseudodesulfovibrio tunisiensis TaxID=463192 RepID=UPI001FB4B3FE|nr:DUF3347 domain-containing protein [Pseudodesulfovibrio tunisiensis]
MQAHYDLLTSTFNLETLSREHVAPLEFRKQLGFVFSSYEPLAEALAADDLQKARSAAEKIAAALRKVEADKLDGQSHNIWTDSLKAMNDGLAAIREATDIVGVRTGFEPLSVGLTRAVLKLGMETDGPVYELFCPMAFDYEGATWLQRDEDVRNPYFGATMLKCGETNRQLKQ